MLCFVICKNALILGNCLLQGHISVLIKGGQWLIYPFQNQLIIAAFGH